MLFFLETGERLWQEEYQATENLPQGNQSDPCKTEKVNVKMMMM